MLLGKFKAYRQQQQLNDITWQRLVLPHRAHMVLCCLDARFEVLRRVDKYGHRIALNKQSLINRSAVHRICHVICHGVGRAELGNCVIDKANALNSISKEK